MTFNEITRKVVTESIQHPRGIDQDLVDAQQARRILDRIVGYKLSPLLWRKVRKGLSAGRVQSVATRMVVDREEEIKAFVRFALISELPFDLAFRRTFFTLNYQNVFFTLFFGLLALSQWQWLTGRKGFHAAWQRQALGLLFIAALALAAEFCRTDYGWQGVAVIALMYLLREYPVPRDLGSLAVLYTSSTLELAAFRKRSRKSLPEVRTNDQRV